MGNPAIEVHQLSKSYIDGWFGRRRFDALKKVSFDVKRGEIFGLLGPNGAGKTTFIKVLLGIVRKTGGTASVLGLPAGARTGRRDIGYLPENLRVPRHHNARSALNLFGQLSGMTSDEVKQRQDSLLESVGLADRAKDSVKKYSKGMLQRLGLAISLLHNPDLLFLDEPTDGLDPVGRNHVRNVMMDLKQQGKTIFLNSHLLQEVEMVCDRVAILHLGELRFVGSVNELGASRLRGLELDLQLIGPEEAILKAIGPAAGKKLVSAPDGTIHVQVRLPDQAAANQCVDLLRKGQVSIVSLAPRRISLEDGFMDLLGEEMMVVPTIVD
jgi:ABC-2 type transport system ATP-binding protein